MKIIIATAVVLASVGWIGVSAEKQRCHGKFKNDPKMEKAVEKCVEKSGLLPGAGSEFEHDHDQNFDDKCYGKCLLSELDLLKGLKFDRAAMKADILEHVLDKEFQSIITAYTMQCLTDEESFFGNVTDDNVCKFSARFLRCCQAEEHKMSEEHCL